MYRKQLRPDEKFYCEKELRPDITYVSEDDSKIQVCKVNGHYFFYWSTRGVSYQPINWLPQEVVGSIV